VKNLLFYSAYPVLFNLIIKFNSSLLVNLKWVSLGELPSYKKQRSTGGSVSVPHDELLQFFILIFFKSFVKPSTSVNDDMVELENALLQLVSEFPVPLHQLHLLFKLRSRHLIFELSG